MKKSCVIKKVLILAIIALFCIPLMVQAETVQFPTSSDTWTIASSPYWWNSGDNVIGDRTLASSNYQFAQVSLYLSDNNLNGTGHVDLDFLINGTSVGTMTVLPSHGTGYVSFPFSFEPIRGETVTLQYLEKNTVISGGGSIIIDPSNSTIDFFRYKDFPWAMFLPAIISGESAPIPPSPPPSSEPGTVASAGQIWMDRNLGASRVATSMADAEAYGDLYQWGRLADGHQSRTSPTTTTISSTDVPGHGSFILATSANSDLFDWRTPQNDNLWQGLSGINNPCPAGFRLPTVAEWQTERASWGSQNSAGAFASPLKLVPAGYRSGDWGELYNAGSDGYYWSSTIWSSYSSYLYFDSGYAVVNDLARSFGRSVRCLKD